MGLGGTVFTSVQTQVERGVTKSPFSAYMGTQQNTLREFISSIALHPEVSHRNGRRHRKARHLNVRPCGVAPAAPTALERDMLISEQVPTSPSHPFFY